jgi:phosphatidylinositol N-acetylglucosaminyltransferase subunit A
MAHRHRIALVCDFF